MKLSISSEPDGDEVLHYLLFFSTLVQGYQCFFFYFIGSSYVRVWPFVFFGSHIHARTRLYG